MTVPQAEEQLSRKPHSPLFAYLADKYLSEQRIAEAKKLLLAGIQRYPQYTTAHLVLAKCFAEEKKFTSAVGEVLSVIPFYPNSVYLRELLQRWQQEELTLKQTPPSTERQTMVASEVPTVLGMDVVEVQQQGYERSKPTPIEGKSVFTKDSTDGAKETDQGDEIVFSAKPEIPENDEAAESDNAKGRIVSKTLAEIYARQGQYKEAIITYQLLQRRQPQFKEEFEKRIQELLTLLHTPSR